MFLFKGWKNKKEKKGKEGSSSLLRKGAMRVVRCV